MKIQITEENKYCTKDIAKWIRQTLKEEFKDCKFSVTTSSYSGGSSISVSLLENNRCRIINTFEEITEQEKLSVMCSRNDTKDVVEDWMKMLLNSKTYNINQYHIESDWMFTKEGKEMLKNIMKIVNKYNYDNSDSQIDYFDVNYYVDISLGSYEKPYMEVQ